MRIIVNPAAAGGRLGREWPRLEKRLTAAGLEAETVFTEAPWHATELAAAAVADGVTRVIAAGGDGTVTEVAEGISRAGGEMAILPLGTGNDAARTLGITTKLEEAAVIARDGAVRTVDLIAVGGHLVFNAIGVGMTGDINERAARLKQTGRLWVRGISGYLLATLASLFQYRRRDVTMTSEAGSFSGSMLILAVHGGPTTGGGFALTPRAIPDDGLFDACLVEEVGPAGRLARLAAAMRGKLGDKKGSHELQSSWLELQFDVPLPAHLDGNAVVLEPPMVRFEVVPQALRVVGPRS